MRDMKALGLKGGDAVYPDPAAVNFIAYALVARRTMFLHLPEGRHRLAANLGLLP